MPSSSSASITPSISSTVPMPGALPATVLAYALVAWAAGAWWGPAQAPLLAPSAGVAVAAVLAWGRIGLLGVALGAVLALGLGWPAGGAAAAWGVAGAVVQAAVAAWLVRRHVPLPLGLGRPRDVGRFLLLAGPVACLPVAVAGLLAQWALLARDAWLAGGMAWAGQVAGVWLGAPVALSLVGRPRSEWAPRRLGVAVPLALAGVLLALALRPADTPAAWGLVALATSCTGLLAAVLLLSSAQAQRAQALAAERTAQWELQVLERQRIEGALRETEQTLRSVFDHTPVGLRYTDRHGNFLAVNPAFCEITGYSADELYRLDVWQITHPDDRVAEDGHFAGLFKGGLQVLERRKRYIHRSGEIRWVRISVRLLGDPLHPEARTVGMVELITENLRLQDAERARRVAEAANRAKSEFLSRMSHELRTPLNAILGFAQLMEMERRPPLAAQQAQWNTQLQKAGWHLLRMIDDVLDFARIDTGHLRLRIAALDLAPVLAEARSFIAQAAAQRGLTVAESVGHPAARALGDATRVKQILTNLLSNAVKYNVAGGSIHVAVRTQGEALLSISVQDTGLGMTPQQLGQLFQPFNRLGREASAVEGNGIGLVIARRLAELMGGSLSARSAPGAGTTFTLLLPRAADEAPREAEPPPQAACAHEAAYPLRNVHYIEDDEVNAEVMRGILLQRPQVTLSVSRTGREGLAAIRRDLPSLVLLDMNLPDMEGLQVLHELRHHAGTAGIPVLVVSADTTSELIAAATEAGATHVLGKPVHVPELLRLLDECLEGQVA